MNKERPIKSGLVFGIVMTVFFVLRNLFSLDEFSSDGMLKPILTGIIAGLISGLIFGLLLWSLKKIKA